MSTNLNQPFGAEELYNQAWLFHKSGNFQGAIDLLAESLSLREHYKSCELLAVCYQEIGESRKALQHLEQAYKLNERSSKTACMLAQHLFDSGDIHRCKAMVEKVLQNHKDYGPAKRLLERIMGAAQMPGSGL